MNLYVEYPDSSSINVTAEMTRAEYSYTMGIVVGAMMEIVMAFVVIAVVFQVFAPLINDIGKPPKKR